MTRAGQEEGCPAEQRGTGESGAGQTGPGQPDSDRPRRRRRGSHRRVVAPPTNPEADDSDDTVVPGESDPGTPGESARDAWIRAQRPPHWG